MTSKLILSIAAFFYLNALFAQDRIWIKQTKISEVVAFEKEISPNPKFLTKNVSLSKDYYPLIDKYEVTNPIIVQREPLGYLPVYAEYFYTPKDSILRLVSYDWEKDRYGNFFDKQKIWQEESTKFKVYDTEYERIRAVIVNELGAPASTDKVAKKRKSENTKYFTRESIWETKDFHAQLTMTFASTTYRIRFTIYWKK
ncbi:MAG: hypothetical protein K2Q24_07945 [Chitinophagaceae bacterium]|nr:hypothetical protein [Chitinophagaceae bacterium]